MRTDRPELPTRPTELDRTERLQSLTVRAKPGNEVAIDRDVLAELYERLGEAVGAVERGNNRTRANRQLWDCVVVIFGTGKAPTGCTAAGVASD